MEKTLSVLFYFWIYSALFNGVFMFEAIFNFASWSTWDKNKFGKQIRGTLSGRFLLRH